MIIAVDACRVDSLTYAAPQDAHASKHSKTHRDGGDPLSCHTESPSATWKQPLLSIPASISSLDESRSPRKR